jgi:hypothetical protein
MTELIICTWRVTDREEETWYSIVFVQQEQTEYQKTDTLTWRVIEESVC